METCNRTEKSDLAHGVRMSKMEQIETEKHEKNKRDQYSYKNVARYIRAIYIYRVQTRKAVYRRLNYFKRNYKFPVAYLGGIGLAPLCKH